MTDWPTYYELLGEAYDAQESVDEFDVRSEDPASKAEWDRLLALEQMARNNLIRFIIVNRSWIYDEAES